MTRKVKSKQDDNDKEVHTGANVIIPPDGGWGWVVVFASFISNVIVDGILFSNGYIMAAIKDEFQVSESEVTPIGSLFAGFYLILGPLTSVMANKYGFRIVSISGSIIAGISLSVSYYITNIKLLYMTYGIFGGLGCSLVYLPSVLIVGFYFERWRALATGIAVSGAGVGSFTVAPLTEYIIRTYNWRITAIVHGMMMFLTLLCGIVYRPIEPVNVVLVEDDDESKENHKENKLIRFPQTDDNSKTWCVMSQSSDHPTVAEIFNSRRHSTSQTAYVKFSKQCDREHSGAVLVKTNLKNSFGPLNRDDAFYSGDIKQLPQYKSNTSIGYHLSVTHIPEDDPVEQSEENNNCCSSLISTLIKMFDFKLFRSPSFLLLAASGFFVMTGCFVPYNFIVKRNTSAGFEAVTWLIPAIGISNTVCRFLCGLLSSVDGISPLWVNNIALTIGGIATAISGLSYNTTYQIGYCFTFGFASACFMSLRSILTVEYIGLERLTSAFGLLLLIQSIGALLSSTIAGALIDMTGDYDTSFYAAGIFILISGIVTFPLNYVKTWETNRERQKPLNVRSHL